VVAVRAHPQAALPYTFVVRGWRGVSYYAYPAISVLHCSTRIHAWGVFGGLGFVVRGGANSDDDPDDDVRLPLDMAR